MRARGHPLELGKYDVVIQNTWKPLINHTLWCMQCGHVMCCTQDTSPPSLGPLPPLPTRPTPRTCVPKSIHTHLEAEVHAAHKDVLRRPVDLAVAVLLKLAHGEVLVVAPDRRRNTAAQWPVKHCLSSAPFVHV